MAEIIWTEPTVADLNEIPELNYRELAASPCRVFYRTDKTFIHIMHICRAERDLRKFLTEKGIKQ